MLASSIQLLSAVMPCTCLVGLLIHRPAGVESSTGLGTRLLTTTAYNAHVLYCTCLQWGIVTCFASNFTNCTYMYLHVFIFSSPCANLQGCIDGDLGVVLEGQQESLPHALFHLVLLLGTQGAEGKPREAGHSLPGVKCACSLYVKLAPSLHCPRQFSRCFASLTLTTPHATIGQAEQTSTDSFSAAGAGLVLSR